MDLPKHSAARQDANLLRDSKIAKLGQARRVHWDVFRVRPWDLHADVVQLWQQPPNFMCDARALVTPAPSECAKQLPLFFPFCIQALKLSRPKGSVRYTSTCFKICNIVSDICPLTRAEACFQTLGVRQARTSSSHPVQINPPSGRILRWSTCARGCHTLCR